MIRNARNLIFFLVLLVGLTSQQAMDFYPPSLKTALQKADSTTTQLKELALTEITKSQIQMGKFYVVTKQPINQFVYIGRVNACRSGGCLDPSLIDEFEFFDYFILYDSTFTVQEVKVYNYQASHGQEITSKNWLKQFRKYNGTQKLETGKSIDGISGATTSVEAIVFDIEQKTKLLREEAPK